jgi:hypothetical protein
MTQETDRLKIMAKNAPGQVEKIESSIATVESTVEELNKQKSAIEDGVCGNAKAELTDYLENTKLAEIESLYGNPSTIPFSVEYGANYGTINYTTGGITDFTIVDVTGNVEYEYSGINWDFDSTIIGLVEDFAFGNDYLTREPDTGATYGIIPKINSLTTAANLLNENANKVADSQAVFNKYAT